VNQARTDTGATPLLAAAEGGQVDVVRLLLEKDAAANQGRMDDGATPFLEALVGNVEVVRLLAVFGANTTTGIPDGDWTPQSIAIDQGLDALAKWLSAVETWTPLQIAAGCRLYSAATTALRFGLID
jgi:ankyrin repeat protein